MKKKSAKETQVIRYSGTEFGAVLEAVHKDVKTIAEGHSGLEKRLDNIEREIHGNSRRLDNVEFSTRATADRVGRLEDAVSLLSKDLKDVKNELKNDIKNLGDRLTSVESGRP